MPVSLMDEIDECIRVFEPTGAGAARAELVFPASFSGFQGHFPGNPLCPGVCLVMAQIAIARRITGARLELLEMANVKFIGPVFPNEAVCCAVNATREADGKSWHVKSELKRGERGFAKFLLLAGEKVEKVERTET